MKLIDTVGRVSEDHDLSVRVPADVPPGEHRMVTVLETAAGGFAQPAAAGAIPSAAPLRRQANLLVYDGAPAGNFFDSPQEIHAERQDTFSRDRTGEGAARSQRERLPAHLARGRSARCISRFGARPVGSSGRCPRLGEQEECRVAYNPTRGSP